MFVVRGIEMPYIAMIAVATGIYYYSASLQELAYDEQVRVCGKSFSPVNYDQVCPHKCCQGIPSL